MGRNSSRLMLVKSSQNSVDSAMFINFLGQELAVTSENTCSFFLFPMFSHLLKSMFNQTKAYTITANFNFRYNEIVNIFLTINLVWVQSDEM